MRQHWSAGLDGDRSAEAPDVDETVLLDWAASHRARAGNAAQEVERASDSEDAAEQGVILAIAAGGLLVGRADIAATGASIRTSREGHRHGSSGKEGNKGGEMHRCDGVCWRTREENESGCLAANCSPRSETSDRVFKDQERREMSKKRKTLPKWSNQVRVNPGGGIEAPLDDGYSWRKYGQKDILGAKYPRGYYRCTHRTARGCLATKQVQRSDNDPTIFDVIYRGEHTCFSEKTMAAVAAAAKSQQTGMQQSHKLAGKHQKQQQQQQQENQLLLNFQTNLKVKTEGLDMEEHEQNNSSSFSFPSTPIGCLQPRHNFFASQATLDNHFMDSFSPSFLSPTTSESNYFSVSPCRMSNLSTGFNHHTAESEYTEIISAVTSAANSPVVDMGFILEPTEFDAFDPSNFF